jgi:hypothetical protein
MDTALHIRIIRKSSRSILKIFQIVNAANWQRHQPDQDAAA